ncbi:MAG: hypothetical protein D6693_10065 [Planctomycetota bacterium]|nr:MAG: hypothetical protein D6693_10065 [Planctomycetota bacterium]
MNTLDGFTLRALFDLASAAVLAGGLFFMVVGALGVVRLPDAYNRIHAASICVTLGLSAMLLAACFHLGAAPIIMKSIITVTFIFVATPIGSHMLAKAAHDTHQPQWAKTLSDEFAEDKARFGWADPAPADGDAAAEPHAA